MHKVGAVFEKHLVSLAQIIVTRLTVNAICKAISGTFTMAQREPLTAFAGSSQTFRFVGSECYLTWTFEHFT